MKRELKIFDKPETVNRFLILFYVCLFLLLVADFFIHKHITFPWEGAIWFFPVYGFMTCVALIFVAKIIRHFVKREEDYYE